MKVGDEIYVEQLRSPNGLNKTKISKIGRKYFELDNYHCKFCLDTLYHYDKEYSSMYKCWKSIEEYDKELLRVENYDFVWRFFRDYQGKKLSLDQLERIKTIIEEK